MEGLTISTERVRQLLGEIGKRGLDYRVCAARDIVGPGGGVYITAGTPLEGRHLSWLERRSPAGRSEVLVEVVLQRADEGPVHAADLELTAAVPDPDYHHGAERVSAEVCTRAQGVAQQAEAVYRAIGKADPGIGDLRRADTEGGLREFEARVKSLQAAVRNAIDLYLSGNTLVLDLIVKFQLGKKAVRHALNVAAFATEMAARLALVDRGLAAYFDDYDEDEETNPDGLASKAAGGPPDQSDDGESREARFRRELAEIFLGGFMHDCGLWNEPYCLAGGHEAMGAKLAWELGEVRRYAPSLVKMVLFHSDVLRLAECQGVVKVVESPEDPDQVTFRREFYRTDEDARTAVEIRSGEYDARILTPAELRHVLPVALAERYVTQTQDIHARARWEVINDLARHARRGLYLQYVVSLCNLQVEVIAPRRAYVVLDGVVSVSTHDSRQGRRAQRLDVTEFEAVSLRHAGDRNSPHLITLFLRRPDGSRCRAAYLTPQDADLWERCAGPESRLYIPVGRFRNGLSCRVTGFVSEEVYARVLLEYERELESRQAR
ncbi:MAG: hypothetical protein WDA75_24595 [Candidatus Latescibacterota bacterium]